MRHQHIKAKYLGISKLCCSLCYLVLGDDFKSKDLPEVRGCHGCSYPHWENPGGDFDIFNVIFYKKFLGGQLYEEYTRLEENKKNIIKCEVLKYLSEFSKVQDDVSPRAEYSASAHDHRHQEIYFLNKNNFSSPIYFNNSIFNYYQKLRIEKNRWTCDVLLDKQHKRRDLSRIPEALYDEDLTPVRIQYIEKTLGLEYKNLSIFRGDDKIDDFINSSLCSILFIRRHGCWSIYMLNSLNKLDKLLFSHPLDYIPFMPSLDLVTQHIYDKRREISIPPINIDWVRIKNKSSDISDKFGHIINASFENQEEYQLIGALQDIQKKISEFEFEKKLRKAELEAILVHQIRYMLNPNLDDAELPLTASPNRGNVDNFADEFSSDFSGEEEVWTH